LLCRRSRTGCSSAPHPRAPGGPSSARRARPRREPPCVLARSCGAVARRSTSWTCAA
jgi:hypothetical protein